MGCLTISATIVPSDLQITAENMNTGLEISARKVGDGLTLTAEKKNTGLALQAENKNTRLKLTAALVCGIGLDKYEFLYVDEGPLIVKDGYLKVLKKKSLL